MGRSPNCENVEVWPAYFSAHYGALEFRSLTLAICSANCHLPEYKFLDLLEIPFSTKRKLCSSPFIQGEELPAVVEKNDSVESQRRIRLPTDREERGFRPADNRHLLCK